MAEAITPYISIDAVTLPQTSVVVPMSITVGRSDPSGQPNANSLSFNYRGPTLPAYLRRGAPAQVEVRPKGGSDDVWEDVWDDVWKGGPPSGAIRFLGSVSDIGVTPSPTEHVIYAQVTCTGVLVELSNQIIGDEPWPVETDFERTKRIASLSRSKRIIVNEGSPVLRVRARDVDRQKVLDLLHLFAGSVGSILWEYPDGSIHYQRYDVRQAPPSAVYLPSHAIEDTAVWSQQVASLIDRVRVQYGDDPTEGERTEYVAGEGAHETMLGGETADLASATIIGDAVLARWGRQDVWEAPEVATRSSLLDDLTYQGVLGLLPSDALHTGNLTLIPSPGDGGEGLWFVEGWTEQWDRPGNGTELEHSIKFAVTDVRLFASTGAIVALVLTVTPTTWAWGKPATITARVTVEGGGPLPEHGVLSLVVDGFCPVLPYDLDELAPGNPPELVQWDMDPYGFKPGPHVFQVTYSGSAGEAQPGTSNTVDVSVTGGANGGITITAATVEPRTGDYHVIEVDLWQPPSKPPNFDAYPLSGTVTFYRRIALSGGAWQTYATVDGTVNEPLSLQWYVDGTDWEWYARYSAENNADPPVVALVANSNTLRIWPQSRTEQTLTYNVVKYGTYDGTGVLTADTDVRQGDWGDGRGDMRGLLWFGINSNDWVGYTITKVEVYLLVSQFQNGAAGTIRIGSHQQPEDPATADATAYAHRTDVPGWAQNTSKWVDITSWGKNILSGFLSGIAIGPADGTGADTQAVLPVGTPSARWDDAVGTWDEQAGTWDGEAGSPVIQLRASGYRWN